MDKISIYDNSKIILEKTCPKIIIIWIFSTITLIALLFTFSCLYKYNKIISLEGIIIKEGNDYYVQTFCENITKINQTNQVLINDSNYKYKIISSYYNNKYYKINLKIELEDYYLVENNILDLQFKQPKTTLLNEILKYLKKELIYGKNK